METSAQEQLFGSLASHFQHHYPHPERIEGEQRQKLQKALKQWTNGFGHAHCYLAETDHVVPLEQRYWDADFNQPKIWQLDMTGNFSGNHYVPTYQHLLQAMEEAEPQIQPGKTRMLEVTTGSAGIAFGHIGQLAGYPRELFAPAEIREHDPARWELMRQAVEGHDACGGQLIASEGGEFLASALHDFRKRIAALGGSRGRREGLFALPNHSMREETVNACTAQFLNAMGSATMPSIDAAVVGMGNGTSAEAMKRALEQKYGSVPAMFGFEGKHNPGVWQRLHGPLNAREREDHVWMYGVDGTGNIGVDFRYVQKFMDEGVLRNIILVSRNQCEDVFEALNQKQEVGNTMGRSSAGSIAVAAEVARKYGCKNVCCLRYDTAAPYGHFIPLYKDSRYLGGGKWSKQMDASVSSS